MDLTPAEARKLAAEITPNVASYGLETGTEFFISTGADDDILVVVNKTTRTARLESAMLFEIPEEATPFGRNPREFAL